MQLNTLDWLIAAASLLAAGLPALFYWKRAGTSASEFFTSGQSAPWWLIGTSMVATTFSADTPNLVTDFVRQHGVSYNWVWWAFLLTGMTTVFFYARLWRRSGVLTDLEFYELRYAGKPAAFVRGFRAIYLGFFFNCAIMATVTLAAIKISNVMLGWGRLETVVICGAICIVFASVSGLWGVLAIDLVQFVIKMSAVIAAAWYALDHPKVGGLQGLVTKLDPKTLSLLPDFGDWGLTLSVLVIPLTVQWWSVWYPGAEPGGGSYIAQRMLAARDERHAMAGTMWFNVAHYALRPWPWIITALASMIVFPSLADLRTQLPHVDPALIGHDLAFPAMLTLLPHGMLGVMIAALLAAYVSTIVTHLNWGSSYLVIDIYHRFLSRDATEQHLVWISRGLSIVLMAAAAAFTLALTTASAAFQLLLSVGAGTGLLYLLRWFWWRINAWSEITAMGVSFAVATGFFVARQRGMQLDDGTQLLLTVGITTVAWVAVTLLTPPTDEATLAKFYAKVRPAGPGWRAIRERANLPASPDSLPQQLLGMTCGVAWVYSALFGTGNLLYGHLGQAAVCLAVFAASSYGLLRAGRALFAAPATPTA
ncbi:MAG: Na+:solute symporter [Gemmatimonadetes bacterium]|nr:Na+:solute symporter [Gemmatimonadota bacterium]